VVFKIRILLCFVFSILPFAMFDPLLARFFLGRALVPGARDARRRGFFVALESPSASPLLLARSRPGRPAPVGAAARAGPSPALDSPLTLLSGVSRLLVSQRPCRTRGRAHEGLPAPARSTWYILNCTDISHLTATFSPECHLFTTGCAAAGSPAARWFLGPAVRAGATPELLSHP
jgi:hypothetical protein